MRLYHGSLEVVEAPEILLPSRTLDYGSGFYVTTSERQAREWAERRIAEKRACRGYVNVYDFDSGDLEALNTLVFTEPNEEWAEFVMANRTRKGFSHNYDIVYGPVANDRVYLQFGLYEAGVISVATLVSELKTYKLVDQYVFHTERALAVLRFVEAAEIRR